VEDNKENEEMAVMQGPREEQGMPPEEQRMPPEEQEMPQEDTAVYPANKEEAEVFILNLVKVIHQEEKIPQMLSQKSELPVEALIAAIASKMLVLMFTQAFKQTQGKSVAAGFAVEAVRRAVTEVAEIAEKILKRSITRSEVQKAAKIAGDTLQQTMEKLVKGEKPQGQPMGQPQGQPMGPQGQPQGQGIMQGGM
jgi:hypothetical protein